MLLSSRRSRYPVVMVGSRRALEDYLLLVRKSDCTAQKRDREIFTFVQITGLLRARLEDIFLWTRIWLEDDVMMIRCRYLFTRVTASWRARTPASSHNHASSACYIGCPETFSIDPGSPPLQDWVLLE
jgi:hypothetical protein